jgi:hypothetical protein
MKQIEPYVNVSEAISSLDNGGRFYNVLTHAEDGIISQSEVGKVGGLFNEKQKVILFLELSISKLDAGAKADLISKLDDNLQANYQKYKPQELLPSEANSKAVLSANAIITGFPKMVDSRSEFTGLILIPIMAGKAMTFIPVPIIEKYDIYEIRDERSSETFLIAHAKDSDKLPEQKIKVAGVLKELKMKKDDENSVKKFLEINYFLHLD